MLASLLIGTLIGTMGNSIVSIALPSLMDHYSISLSSTVWSITLYTLTFSVFIPIFGSLSRTIGFKRLFTTGMVVVTVSSVLCIFAPNYPLFLVARVALGVGVATVLPTIMGIISYYFPTEIQGKATGYWALVNSLGHAIGPTLGGFLLAHFAWQSIFWINIPLALISIGMALKFFPKDERTPNRWFDWIGATAMTVLVFSGMMGISRAGQNGLGATDTLILLAIAIVSLVFLLWYERKIDNPFINLALFKRKNYIASIIPISLQAFTQFGLLVSLPVFLIDTHNVEKQIAGLIIMSMTVMMAITSPIAGRLTDKFSSKWVCLAGAVLVGLGAFLMFVLRTDELTIVSWIWFILCLVIFGTGFGLIQSGSTVAAIQASPMEIAGAATGFFHMIRFISASLGSTVFGMLFEAAVGNPMGGFYNSFLLIIVLAAITIPFTFWISANKDGRVAALQPE
jgi:EmrB/QacA subfamily drug resistance transporter